MTSKRTTRGHAALYMAPTIVQALLPVVTLPIFTKVLSKAEYGLWGIATAFGALVSGLAGLGLQVGFERSYFAAADDSARGRLLFSVLVFALTAQVVALVVVCTIGPTIAVRLMHSRERWPLLALGFSAAAIGALKMFFLVTLRNEGKARQYVTFSVDELFLSAGISLAAVLWLKLGVTGLLVGPIVAGALVSFALVASFAGRMTFGFDRALLRDTLDVSLPLAPRAIIGAVGSQLDRLVLGAIGSLANVGLYTIGQRMAQLVFAFATALQNVYQPRVYQLFFSNAPPREIGQYLMPFAYASAGVAFAAIVFAQEILYLTADAKFASAAVILTILAVHYGLSFFGKQPQLTFARRTGLISWLSVLSILLNGPAVYLGARLGGATGAALGVLVAGVITGGIGLAIGTRFAPIAYPLLPAVIVFSSLPAALAAVWALEAAALPTLLTVSIKFVALTIYIGVGWRLGYVQEVWGRR